MGGQITTNVNATFFCMRIFEDYITQYLNSFESNFSWPTESFILSRILKVYQDNSDSLVVEGPQDMAAMTMASSPR